MPDVPSLSRFLNQKQPPEVFYKKDIYENFAIFTGKHLFGVSFNKVAYL